MEKQKSPIIHCLMCERRASFSSVCLSTTTIHPIKFLSAIQSYCSCLSVVLLSYDSRSTLLRLDRRKNMDGRCCFYLLSFCFPQTDRQTDTSCSRLLNWSPGRPHAWNKTTQRKFLEFVRNGINIGTYVRIICNSFNNCIFLAAQFWLDRRALFWKEEDKLVKQDL